MNPVLEPGSRWRSIDPHRPFLKDLAAGLIEALGPDGADTLADAVVLTPTRRSARALEAAFAELAGAGALLLPQILALGDLDEGEPPFEPGTVSLDLAPAATPDRRRFEIAGLVRARSDLFDRPLDARGALDVADALVEVLDALQIEEVDARGRLDGLVDADHLARHWARASRVLSLAVEDWPDRLRALGLLDVNARRTRLLRSLAHQWRISPPQGALIAAGSTGSAPATADLLHVVASSPKGLVVLPGLDRDLADEAWDAVDDAHPQSSLKRLLDRLGVDRRQVEPWIYPTTDPGAAAGRARRRLVNEALRPASQTKDWLDVIGGLRAEDDMLAAAVEGLSLAEARNEAHAAALIAVLIRETLEVADKTVALICPDPELSRRVCARLVRFGVEADVSAGYPLARLPHGVLISLIARLADRPLDPARLLGLIKHPLVRAGLAPQDLARARRALERAGLRGPEPADWPALEARVAGRDGLTGQDDALRLLRAVRDALEALRGIFADGRAEPRALARALAEALERLAANEDGRTPPLWSGADGEAASVFLAELIDDADALGPVATGEAGELIDALLARRSTPLAGAHPRLVILGALEARLLTADRLILAGLEEGVWPRPPPADPFLSRAMRAALGLPSPERRLGLSAHDFAQAACAPEVILVTSARRGGQPAVRSRWLWRLETLLRGAGRALPRRLDAEAWTSGLDAALTDPPPSLRQAQRPAPRPPLEARPRRLAVTRIEAWVRDPYAVYARDILRLRPMDRPGAAMEAHRRGSAVHKAFQRYAETWTQDPAAQSPERFEALLMEELSASGFTPSALAREAVLGRGLGAFASAFETARRRGGAAQVFVEIEGATTLATPGGPFTVTAKADRMELVAGRVDIIDFKTGLPPTASQVKAGFHPQLSLTAAIAEAGGFAQLGPAAPGELLYVRASGRRNAAAVTSAVAKDVTASELAALSLEGLTRLIARFDRLETPYVPWTAPKLLAARAGDYDHLSRLFEWRVLGETEADG